MAILEECLVFVISVALSIAVFPRLAEDLKTLFIAIKEFLLREYHLTLAQLEEMYKQEQKQCKNTESDLHIVQRIENWESQLSKAEPVQVDQTKKRRKPFTVEQCTQVNEVDFEVIDYRKELRSHSKAAPPTLSVLMEMPPSIRGDDQDLKIMKKARQKAIEFTRDIGVQTEVEVREIGVNTEEPDLEDLLSPRSYESENETYSSPTETPRELQKEEETSQEGLKKSESFKKLRRSPQTTKRRKAKSLCLDKNPFTKQLDTLNESGKHVRESSFEMRVMAMDISSTYSGPANINKAFTHMFEEIKRKNNKKTPTEKILISPKDTKLGLRGQFRTSLPNILMEAEQITILDLSDNYLTSLPNWFFNAMKSLTVLNLSHNYFYEITGKFDELKKLRELDLSYNKFEFIPPSLLSTELSSLSNINLSHNSLMVIPNDIVKLKNSLTDFDISHNLLLELPDDFKQLKRLRHFKYNDNNFLYFTVCNHLKRLSSLQPEDAQKKRISFRKEKKYPVHEGDDCTIERILLLLELLESERMYVRYLNIFHEIIFIPLSVMCASNNVKNNEISISKEDMVNILPKEIEKLIEESRLLLLDLEKKLKTIESNPTKFGGTEIGKIFLKREDFFKNILVPYILLYEKSTEALRELRKSNYDLEKFLASRRKLHICDGMDLESFLQLPILRIYKYNTILQKIQKVTPPNHPDYSLLSKAIQMLTQCQLTQSKHIAKVNNRYRMQEISKTLKINNLLKPGRYLIKEGKITISPTKEIDHIKSEIKKLPSIKDVNFGRSINISQIKDLKLDDLPVLKSLVSKNITDVRLTESYVYLYLFSDMMIIKELSFFGKLVGQVNSYDLHTAEVYDAEGAGNKFIVLLENGQKEFSFIAEGPISKKSWYEAFVTTITNLNNDNPKDDIQISTTNDDFFGCKEDSDYDLTTDEMDLTEHY